jgi:hypothetical protein
MAKINVVFNGAQYSIDESVLSDSTARLYAYVSAVADVPSSEGLRFRLSDDGVSYILSGIGECTDTDVIIPSTYNDLPVTRINTGAFFDCNSLTSITIPDSVTSIGETAFQHCHSLTSVIIGDGVTSIEPMAFLSCSSLTNLTIGGGVTSIGDSAFSQCPSIASITFNGTIEQWNSISKPECLKDSDAPVTYVQCTDGTVAL